MYVPLMEVKLSELQTIKTAYLMKETKCNIRITMTELQKTRKDIGHILQKLSHGTKGDIENYLKH